MVAPPVGNVPGTVFGASLSPDGENVWVAGYNGTSSPGFVSLINVANQQVSSSITVGAGPADIAFSPAGGRAFVSNYDGASLSVINIPRQQVIQTLDLSGIPLSNPFGIVGTSGRVFLTTQGEVSQGSNNLLASINPSVPLVLSNTISDPGQSGRPAVVPAGAPAFGGSVLVPTFVTGTAYDAGYPALVAVNAANATANNRRTLWTSRATPEAVVVSPDGKYAYVSLFDSVGGNGGVWVVSLQNLTTVNVILTCDPENFGEAISKDGKYLLVAGFSKNEVALIDTATDTVDAIINVGHQPNAIVLSGDNSEAFVTNQADGTVTVISFSPSL